MAKEIFEREIQKEDYSEPKLNVEFAKRKSQATTFRGRLRGDLQKARNDKNVEMSFYVEEILDFFNECYPQKIVKYELELLDGWKAKGATEIYKGFKEDFIIIEKIKDKETNEVKSVKHAVAKENLNRLLFWIKKWEVGEEHKCYDFASILGENDWKEVWKKRTDVYFPKYYYPIKCLEALGIIKYSGRGDITKLK